MDNPLEQFGAFTKMWADVMMRMCGAGLSGFPWQPATPPAEAAREMRSGMLKAMTQSYDEMLRSPATLEWMKQSMDAMVAFRKQMNELLGQAHEQAQNASTRDIDNLMRAMRHLEQRLLDRVDDLEEKMDQVAKRLRSLQSEASEEQDEEEAENGEANGRARARRRFGNRGLRRTAKGSELGSADE